MCTVRFIHRRLLPLFPAVLLCAMISGAVGWTAEQQRPNSAAAKAFDELLNSATSATAESNDTAPASAVTATDEVPSMVAVRSGTAAAAATGPNPTGSDNSASLVNAVFERPSDFISLGDFVTLPVVYQPPTESGSSAPAAAGSGSSLRGPGSLSISGTRGQRSLSGSIAGNVLTNADALKRSSTDAGGLMGGDTLSTNIGMQKRTPIVTDVRTRGNHTGQLLASGSYWVPARADLDTLLSKIDSRLIEEMAVIKGPYSATNGPGFNFVDFRLLRSPRFEDGFESHGSSSIEYKTNGDQWYGRQTLWGGDSDYGYRISYGHRTGNDYLTGDALMLIPSSYNARDIDFAVGMDLSDKQDIEFHFLRLDQTDVEFPGMVFDMDYLKTDAVEVTLTTRDQPDYDEWILESWFNRTMFEGDTLKFGKRWQIPSLPSNLFPYDGSGDAANIDDSIRNRNGVGFAITDVFAMSTGFSSIFSWGADGDPQLSLGLDLRAVQRELNDIEPLRPSNANNFPIPPSWMVNPGLLFEYDLPATEDWMLKFGGRLDVVTTDAENNVRGVGDTTINPGPTFTGTPITITDRLETDSLNAEFELWSLFMTSEYALTETLSVTGGVGFAQRAPTLTELYTAGSFINLLQSGLTTLKGDPELKKETVRQIDAGLRYRSTDKLTRASGNIFYAWIDDYITLDGGLIADPALIGQRINRNTFVNTPHATLSGFELETERDVTPVLTAFATMSYTEGRDHTRLVPSRTRSVGNRSETDNPKEPLPGIPPLESRLGFRVHSRTDNPYPWSIEFLMRMVDNQDRVAYSLFERPTPGFTTIDIRGNWQATDGLRLSAGVENMTDKYYREHLDYRPGRGVFQPGVNFYYITELTY